MKELIKITKNEEGQQLVSARELHEFLEVTERFSNWFSRQLQYGFIEGVDFSGCKVFNTLAKQDLQDYAITIDMAKEISMIQRTDKGRQARKYFIKCEKKLREEILNKELTEADKINKLLTLLPAEQRGEYMLKLVDKFYPIGNISETNPKIKSNRKKAIPKEIAIEIFKSAYDEAYICNKGDYAILDKKIVYKKAYSKGISKREFNKLVLENEMVRPGSNGKNVDATFSYTINGKSQRQFYVDKDIFSL